MKCEDCKWSLKISWKVNNEDRCSFECHRNSPELTLKNVEEDCKAWPPVKADDFCGEFQPK